jgi:hypothetical protein
MKHILCLCLLIILFCSACKKETSSHKTIGSIDITDANSLIFGSIVIDPHSGEDISDSLKLYKLTNADEIHPVTLLSDDDKDLKNEFVPDGIYNLNGSYFLFNVYHKSDQEKKVESYVISKLDGTASQLSYPVIPGLYKGDTWVKGYPSAGFVSSGNNFYIPDGEKINKLYLYNDLIALESVLLNSPYFNADTLGNVLAENTLVFTDNTQVQVPEIQEQSYKLKQFGSGFYVVNIETDTVRIKNLDIVAKNYTLSNRKKISTNTSQWNYLGNASIPGLKGSCLVFDKAIIYIDSDVVRTVSFSVLGLNTIKGFYVSNNALYLNGLNMLSKEVFLKINPKTDPPSYSDVFAPDYYYYNFIQVSQDGGLSFDAKLVYGSKEVFGFRSAGQTASVVDNDFGIKVKQVLTIK